MNTREEQEVSFEQQMKLEAAERLQASGASVSREYLERVEAKPNKGGGILLGALIVAICIALGFVSFWGAVTLGGLALLVAIFLKVSK